MTETTPRQHASNRTWERAVLGVVAVLVGIAIPAMVIMWSDVRVIQGNRFTAMNALEMESRLRDKISDLPRPPMDWVKRIEQLEDSVSVLLRRTNDRTPARP